MDRSWRQWSRYSFFRGHCCHIKIQIDDIERYEILTWFMKKDHKYPWWWLYTFIQFVLILIWKERRRSFWPSNLLDSVLSLALTVWFKSIYWVTTMKAYIETVLIFAFLLLSVCPTFLFNKRRCEYMSMKYETNDTNNRKIYKGQP